jgi:hypothetical protein
MRASPESLRSILLYSGGAIEISYLQKLVQEYKNRSGLFYRKGGSPVVKLPRRHSE